MKGEEESVEAAEMGKSERKKKKRRFRSEEKVRLKSLVSGKLFRTGVSSTGARGENDSRAFRYILSINQEYCVLR